MWPGSATIIGYTDTYNQPHYHQALYTGAVPTRNPGGWCQDLSAQGPDSPGWNNYTLATAQLPDSANPNGDPANTVLLALDKATGTLWESQNPIINHPPNGQSCSANPQQSICAIIGTSWTQIGVPWGTSPPKLISADVNRRPRQRQPGTVDPQRQHRHLLDPGHLQQRHLPEARSHLLAEHTRPRLAAHRRRRRRPRLNGHHRGRHHHRR